jgi:hypothetical protein
MKSVVRTFEVLKILEIILIAVGIALTYAFRRNDFAYSAGIGMVLQGSIMLVFDLVAAGRTERYLEALRAVVGS